MTDSRTLHALGKEYEVAAQTVKERIDRKRTELKSLQNSACSIEAYEIKRELKILYAEHRQAQEVAEYLKTYYEPHDGKREIFEYK